MCVCLLKYTCKQKCFSKDIQKTDNTGLVACGEEKRRGQPWGQGRKGDFTLQIPIPFKFYNTYTTNKY